MIIYSYECIYVVYRVFFDFELYNFCYFRLEREKEINFIKSLVYDKDNIEIFLGFSWEMC